MLLNTGVAMKENLRQISYALEDFRLKGDVREGYLLQNLFKAVSDLLDGNGYGYAAAIASDIGDGYAKKENRPPLCLGCDEEVQYCECAEEEEED
jgi:hypothetical protein